MQSRHTASHSHTHLANSMWNITLVFLYLASKCSRILLIYYALCLVANSIFFNCELTTATDFIFPVEISCPALYCKGKSGGFFCLFVSVCCMLEC